MNGIEAATAINANPTAMTVVSGLALVTNAIALGYIIWKSRKTGINPYKGEVFTDFKYYRKCAERAIIEQ